MSEMKLGLGLYRHMLTSEYFQFAKQCGCTHLILHLANYYSDDKGIVAATDEHNNYGEANALDPIWELDNLLRLKKEAAAYGLTIYGIENFSPADWYDVLLDGPKKYAQMENLKKIIRNTGKAGIGAFGYNFSLAGVWGHQKKKAARGSAISTCFDASLLNNIDAPIPNGEIWNMTYGPSDGNCIPAVSEDELWDRLAFFLREILPVAEEAGVDMALHPDDPPMQTLRSTPRMVYRPELYQKSLDLVPSTANKLEFCLGSLQEMHGMDLYQAIDLYAAQKKISYIHFRNVKGKVPCYDEVFVDEGDINMLRVLMQLQSHQFDGVLIPDHTPLMHCAAPWHAGMAFALGYMRAALQAISN